MTAPPQTASLTMPNPMAVPNILLLEDVQLDSELILAELENGGIECQCVCVNNRDDYLEQLRLQTFDLILADYALPTFDGVTALELAKALFPDIPFIFISGVLGEELAIETLKSGATDYVLKQRMERLVPSVQRALREAQARTERQRIEQELHRRDQEFRALVENSPDIIARFDAELRHVYVNPAIEAVTGIPQASFIGKTNAELGMPPEASQRWEEVLRQVFLTRQERCLEFDLIAPDGTVKHYQSRLVPEFAPDGSVEFVLSVVRDITEQRRLLVREQLAREQAESASRIKDEFLAVLSHELRSPLNAILGWASLLKSRKLDEAQVVNAIDIIERNAKLQTQLIQDLLDISRIVRGKLNLNVVQVDLAAVVQSAVNTMRLAAESKSIDLRVAIAEGDAEPDSQDSESAAPASLDEATPAPASNFQVAGDPDRLQQVIWNLVSNAIKFTPAGGRIEVLLERQEHHACVSVKDTGKGIKPDFLPHVFEYFRQADASTTRSTDGLGLGLAIVRHLVEMHGGTVSVSSPGEGQGATFRVCLPLTRVDSAENDTSSSAATDHNLNNLNILVVDDDADTRNIVTFVLQQKGASVQTAASVEEARYFLNRNKPDVLVSDIGMPDADGYSLIRHIRALESTTNQSIPAIALTAYASLEDEAQALSSGFQLHLAKPIEPAELVSAIARLVQSDRR